MATFSTFSADALKQADVPSKKRVCPSNQGAAPFRPPVSGSEERGRIVPATLPDSQAIPEHVNKGVLRPTPPGDQNEELLHNKKLEERDRTVRVTAAKIERLMGLTGEVVVNSRWLPSFSESLLTLKKYQRESLMLLDKLHDLSRHNDSSTHTRELISLAREKTKQSNTLLAERINQLDRFTASSYTFSFRPALP